MSYICPVCNGISTIQKTCPICHHNLDDYGRIDQFWGPYSPYREIDDSKMTNGFNDVKEHQCIHIAYCPVCEKDQIVNITEIYEG